MGKTLYESFIQRIKKNIVIVLSFDHRNKEFYEVCSSNPAFYSSCRIVWTNCYLPDSLKRITQTKLKELEIGEDIIKSLVAVH